MTQALTPNHRAKHCAARAAVKAKLKEEEANG